MQAVKEYFALFGKWWWAVLIDYIFGGVGVYQTATGTTTLSTSVWAIIAILTFSIPAFIAFRNVKVQLDKLRSKPEPKLEIADKPYTDKRPLYDVEGIPIAQPFCANVRFRNSPEMHTSEANANKVYAETIFYDINLKEIFRADKLRTNDVPEPPRQLGIPQREYYEVEFNANGNPREYTIAIKHEADDACYVFSDHNYSHFAWRKPEYILQGDKFYVKVDLKGENAEGEFWFILRNYGKGKNIELEITDKPIPDKDK